MHILGLDPSLRSYGWAYLDSNRKDNLIASGHEGTFSSMVPVVRYIHFRSLVSSLLSNFQINLVGIESPAYGGGEYSERHFGLMLFCLEPIFNARIDCVLFDPTTLKYLTGKARASKQDMQRFVRLSRMATSDLQSDEADAYCVAYFSYRFMQLKNGVISPSDLTDAERWTFLERKKKEKKSILSHNMKRTAYIFRENSRFFNFSQIPVGNIELPTKQEINADLLQWLDNEEV
jgi:Holliday junction resolvasome RuvABC endonuclease subunit